MKKLFSLSNIFTLIGLLIIFSSIFVSRNMSTSLVLLGVLISWIPNIYQSFSDYKKSGKANSTLITSLIITIVLFIILFFEFN